MSATFDARIARKRESHIWERDADDWYVEEKWCSARLFDEEPFEGGVLDPACGMGRIVESAREAGLFAIGSDIADRAPGFMPGLDFLSPDYPIELVAPEAGGACENIVTNPPFGVIREFALKAIAISPRKVAMICPVARLPAAGAWLRSTPLSRVLYLTPRPSMPPGHVIVAGRKPGGGKVDFCWLIWQRGYTGAPRMGWLHRDEGPS